MTILKLLGAILFLACVLPMISIFGNLPPENNHRPSRNSQGRPQSKRSRQVIVKKNGGCKRYRMNQYGELFEERDRP
jgi:hypothetical protein